jgi:hypothetical protein
MSMPSLNICTNQSSDEAMKFLDVIGVPGVAKFIKMAECISAIYLGQSSSKLE